MSGGVVLVAMPWEMLAMPSIQLGTLHALLAGEGIEVHSRSSKLAFWEHCLAADTGGDGALALEDYDTVALSHWDIGLGDWIFAPENGSDDGWLRERGVPHALLAKVSRMRELVPSFLDAECDAVLALAPAVVGFTSTFNQNLPSLALATRIKARDPNVRIVFGGANCDGPMGAALLRAFPQVDVVVRGEAEPVLPSLMRDLLARRVPAPRPGLCHRLEGEPAIVPLGRGERPSMDSVPLPDYDEYFQHLARTSFHADVLPQVTLLYESARGCWWGERATCTFCGLNADSMAFRAKAPDRVARELLALASRHRRLSFQIVDNIVAPEYFRTLLPELAGTGHDFGFFLETKSNLSWTQVRTLRGAGVRMMQTGIESLSTPVLVLMRKGVSALMNVRTLVYCARAGIRAFWNLLYGFPGEPEEEYARMAALLPALGHLEPPTPSRLRLDRFSPYQQCPDAFGLRVLGPSSHYAHLYPGLAPELIADLAYTFDHALPQGQRDPEEYAAPVLEAVARWQAGHAGAVLRSRRGPGFLQIDDRRPGLEPAFYTLGPLGRRIHDACAHGANLHGVMRALAASGGALPGRGQVREFLDHLTGLHLLMCENGRYLALDVPVEAPATLPVPETVLELEA